MSVLIYTENWDGKFKKLTYELASYGAAIAKLAGSQLFAVSLGDVGQEELQKLGKYGVTKVLSDNNPIFKNLDSKAYANAIVQAAQKVGANIVIVASTNAGKSIAPRVSVRLAAALASGVNQLPTSIEPFVISKRVYSGGAFAKMALNTEIKVLTLAQNSFDVIDNQVDVVVEDFQSSIDPTTVNATIKDVQKHGGKLLLTDAEIVIAGGRGMKSADNWQPLEQLAELLGGATACSRPVSDEGWRPHSEHTGQTGKIVSPNLYMAIGISGATQHLAGVSASKCIVAINSDKSAPIFEAASYGMVGDAAKVLPKLVEKVKEIKA
jgi:electron transfer flavoprotein alpha subunit